VKRGTVKGGCSQVRFKVNVLSNSDEDDVRTIVALAEAGCFVEQLIRTPVEVQTEVVINEPEDPAQQ
jgi:organic hydroperoxide reductase OsmC/OhrA